MSKTDYLTQCLTELMRSLETTSTAPGKSPCFPTRADFPPPISMDIYPEVYPDEDEGVEYAIIYLHQFGGNEASLRNLARRLRRKLPRSAHILLRGNNLAPPEYSGYSWADSQSELESLDTSRIILVDVIRDGLISKCKFEPKNIMVLGHLQGGLTALSAIASWGQVEFGGVISIGGPLSPRVQLHPAVKAKTPALILRAALGDIDPSALQRIKETFEFVDSETRPEAGDTIPEQPDELGPILDFFAHRLHREEWEKQAIVSFDGGGVRSLGSLLILQELMNRIGDEEKRIDREDGCAESSFDPCLYKPTAPKPGAVPIATASDGLPNSSLFLPCHYFTYAVGTSTGGLISIMLSRLRMTVDDCIEEFKTIGERVFGHPRPLAIGAILWHKFDAKVFEEVIKNITARHSEAGDVAPILFPSDEDLCRTLILAYADHINSDVPYFFRTYSSHRPTGSKMALSRQETSKNYGDPPELPIWQVARATSAAPTYFPRIEIPKGNGHDPRQYTEFTSGGFGTNNPSREAYNDIVNTHEGASSSLGLFISIGTGENPINKFATKRGRVMNAVKAAIKLPSRTFGAHNDMARLAFHDDQDFFPYYRFGGGEHLAEIALDEWKNHNFTMLTGENIESGGKTVQKINLSTAGYLQRDDVQCDLIECAKILVRRRRLRTRDVSQWDRYASASYYECSFKGCKRKRIRTGQLYKEHVKNVHRIHVVDQAIEKQMLESRRYWVYRVSSEERSDLDEGPVPKEFDTDENMSSKEADILEDISTKEKPNKGENMSESDSDENMPSIMSVANTNYDLSKGKKSKQKECMSESGLGENMSQKEVDTDEVSKQSEVMSESDSDENGLSRKVDAVEDILTQTKSRQGEDMSTDNAESDKELPAKATFDIASISGSDYDEDIPTNGTEQDMFIPSGGQKGILNDVILINNPHIRKVVSTQKLKTKPTTELDFLTRHDHINFTARILSIMYDWWDWYREPPLNKGRVRIRWTCQCGKKLWDDFEELRPGAAEDLRKSLDIYEYAKMSHSQGMITRLAGQNSPQSPPAVYLPGGNSALITAAVGSGMPSTNNPGGSQGRRATTTQPRITTSAPGTSQTQDKKYLLLCISKPKDTLRLSQLDVGDIDNDVQLFQKLKSFYIANQGVLRHMILPRKIKSINFRKFERHPRERVLILQDPEILPNTTNPSACHKDHISPKCDTSYDIYPTPPDLRPCIGPNGVEHLLYNPHEAGEQGNNLPPQNVWLKRFPKKERTKLTACPPYQYGIGWGIEFEDCWHLGGLVKTTFVAIVSDLLVEAS